MRLQGSTSFCGAGRAKQLISYGWKPGTAPW